MRICIPTEDDRGLEGMVCGHFGSAPFYTLVDTDSGACEIMGNSHGEHGHGACAPVGLLSPHALDAVICKGMGRGAINALGRAGISVLITEETVVSQVITAASQNKLRPLSAQDACGGHQHGPGQGRSCGH